MISIIKCKYCGQEVIDCYVEGDLAVCGDCIMYNSKNLAFSLCLVFFSGLCFVLTSIQVIFMVPYLLANFNQMIIFALPPLIIWILSGGFSIISYLRYKRNKILEEPHNHDFINIRPK